MCGNLYIFQYKNLVTSYYISRFSVHVNAFMMCYFFHIVI